MCDLGEFDRLQDESGNRRGIQLLWNVYSPDMFGFQLVDSVSGEYSNTLCDCGDYILLLGLQVFCVISIGTNSVDCKMKLSIIM